MCYTIHEVYSSSSYVEVIWHSFSLVYKYAQEPCSLVVVVVTDQ